MWFKKIKCKIKDLDMELDLFAEGLGDQVVTSQSLCYLGNGEIIHISFVENGIIKEKPLCPICNIPMVVRMVKFGENKGSKFWGCSDFPNCKGNRNFENQTRPSENTGVVDDEMDDEGNIPF
jgi:hypothetical protein